METQTRTNVTLTKKERQVFVQAQRLSEELLKAYDNSNAQTASMYSMDDPIGLIEKSELENLVNCLSKLRWADSVEVEGERKKELTFSHGGIVTKLLSSYHTARLNIKDFFKKFH
jgi:hypothetical protein